MGKPAARVTDKVNKLLHKPPILTEIGRPLTMIGSPNVFIGKRKAWRGAPITAAPALRSAKLTNNAEVRPAEAKALAATGTPAFPEAKLFEESIKTKAKANMLRTIVSVAGKADRYTCINHGVGVVVGGSRTVLINGLPACRMGDTIVEPFGPPNKIVGGCRSVFIGN